MPLPTPEPGVVICYEFLWSHEAAQGAIEGEKRRPAVIVIATKTEDGATKVIVAPITRLRKENSGRAIKIPPKVKAHLGLDNERSWIILDELNEFIWPGYYLYPVLGAPPGTYEYGFIPPALFTQIKGRILTLDTALKWAPSRD